MPIYIKPEGIDGDATHDQHKNWIEVSSLQWGVGRAIRTPVGAATNREASEPSVSEVTVTKPMDASSVAIFGEACTGRKGKKVEIHLVTTGNPGETYCEIELTNALVSGYSISSGGDRPTESISFNFTKIQYKYSGGKGDNTKGGNKVAAYDLATAKKS